MHGGNHANFERVRGARLDIKRPTPTTDELDEVILFARRAGYLDADAQLTDAGTRYFNLMTKYKKELETI